MKFSDAMRWRYATKKFDPQRLLDETVVAELLDIERSFVDALIRRGELTVVPLGYRTHRVTDRSLKDYLKRIGA